MTGVERADGAGRVMLFGVVVVPAIVVPGLLFPYVTARAVLFRVLVEIAMLALVYLLARRELSFRPLQDRFFLAMLAFVGIQLVAARAGVAPMHSLYGDLERMWGVWGWIHQLMFYVALRAFMRPGDWRRFFAASVAVSVPVACYGIWQYVHARLAGGPGGAIISTVGNSGLAAAYFLVSIGLSALLASRERRPKLRAALAVAMTANAVALVLAQNRSSFLALLAGAALAALVAGRTRRAVVGGVAVLALLLAVARLNAPVRRRLPPVVERVVMTGSSDTLISDRQRLAQLPVLVAGVRARPLLGVGPENFDFLWATTTTRDAKDVHDREHNAFLEALATSGVLGAAAFAAMWLFLALGMRRAAERGAMERPELAAASGLLAAYLLYLLFWFVDLNSVFVWTAVAAYVQSLSAEAPLLAFEEARPWRPATRMITALCVLVVLFTTYVHALSPLREAHSLMRVVRRDAPAEDLLASLDDALDSPAPQKSHALAVYVDYLSSLHPQLEAARRDPYRAPIVDRAIRRALSELERQRREEPGNVRLLALRTRLGAVALAFYGAPEPGSRAGSGNETRPGDGRRAVPNSSSPGRT